MALIWNPNNFRLDAVAERFGVGQNLFIYKQTKKSAETNWDRAIASWYDEVALFSKSWVKPFK